jgi:hypothetical protein
VPSGVERAFPEGASANVREHAWGDGTGVRCAGARSGKVPVLEAAAQVSPRRLMAPSAAPCAARILAAAASPAPAFAFACTVFLELPVCLVMRRSVKEGRAAAAPVRKATGAKSAHWRIPHPPIDSHGEGYAVSCDACASVVLDAPPPCYPSCPRERVQGHLVEAFGVCRGHLRGMHTAAGGIFMGTRTP